MLAEAAGGQGFPEENIDIFSGSVPRHLNPSKFLKHPDTFQCWQGHAEVSPVTANGNAFQGLYMCPQPLDQ